MVARGLTIGRRKSSFGLVHWLPQLPGLKPRSIDLASLKESWNGEIWPLQDHVFSTKQAVFHFHVNDSESILDCLVSLLNLPSPSFKGTHPPNKDVLNLALHQILVVLEASLGYAFVNMVDSSYVPKLQERLTGDSCADPRSALVSQVMLICHSSPHYRTGFIKADRCWKWKPYL